MENDWKQAVFYHIYPLGFCGVKKEKPDPFNPKHNLGKVEEWIPHLKELGINAVYLGPVFSASYHGYDTADYYHIDSRLGTHDDFKRLCLSFKKAGIRVIVDGVFHHVGRDFWAFKDVLKNRNNSKFCDWFSGLSFNSSNRFGDPFHYDCWENHEELVKLNLNNPDVVNHLFGAIETWIKEYDIDGIRLDVAYALDMNFIRKLAVFCLDIKNNFFLLGEVIHGNYTHWIGSEQLHSVTNYECYKGIYSAHNDRNLFEIAHSLERQFGENGLYKKCILYNFVDNHDVNRIASTVKNPAYLHTAHILLFTIPGIPSIYYGSEWALKGTRTGTSDDSLRPDAGFIQKQNRNFDLEFTIKRLIELRYKYRFYDFRNYSTIHIESELFIFKLYNDYTELIIMINVNDKIKNVIINVKTDCCYCDILNNNERFHSSGEQLKLPVFSHWGRILKKE